MSSPAIRIRLVLLLIALLLPASAAGRDCPSRYVTNYADVCYHDEDDLAEFTVSIASGWSLFAGNPKKNKRLTRERIDGIVEDVMRQLDTRPRNLRFRIYVYRSRAEIIQAYQRLVPGKPAPAAYYAHARRAIAVSLETVTDRMLAHEIAHAVISAGYSPPPSRKTQEILAEYVADNLWSE